MCLRVCARVRLHQPGTVSTVFLPFSCPAPCNWTARPSQTTHLSQRCVCRHRGEQGPDSAPSSCVVARRDKGGTEAAWQAGARGSARQCTPHPLPGQRGQAPLVNNVDLTPQTGGLSPLSPEAAPAPGVQHTEMAVSSVPCAPQEDRDGVTRPWPSTWVCAISVNTFRGAVASASVQA